jgi:surfeit locus 1 family protein
MTKRYQFTPSWFGFVITLISMTLFVKFGLWQYGKAQTKLLIRTANEAASRSSVISFPKNIRMLDKDLTEYWQYKKVIVSGSYDAKYEILLDNQTEAMQVGYHVLTPFKIADSDEYVLVNRGWIPANAVHADTPVVNTSSNKIEITGQIWVPSKKIFTLENKEVLSQEDFSRVWQHLDFDRYQNKVPMKVSALLIKLDPESTGEGFVRNWQVPIDRISTHIGYAYQWFGFAVATLCIFLYMSFNKINEKK